MILKIMANRLYQKMPTHAQKVCLLNGLREEEMRPRFRNVYRLSNSTKTRSFFLKIYNGLLYGNHDLFKFGFKNSRMCEMCMEEDQTTDHLLFECPKVKDLRLLLYNKLQIHPTRVEERYGTGNYSIDYILLHLNKYVYQCKYLEHSPVFLMFKAVLKSEKETECAIAEKNERIVIHLKKWTKIECLMNID